jgi:hypothetical protein
VPSDYYGYIAYELNLDTLRDLRSSRITSKAGAEKELKDAIRNLEANFFRHICYVFERGLRRFPAEASLWADFVQFLKKKKSSSVLNTILGRALALFPKNEQFWIEAAAHELSDNNSTHAARLLFQRGLRVNKSSKELWKRYFELELWNISRITERQKILDIQPTTASAEDEDEQHNAASEQDVEDPGVPRKVTAPLVVFKYATAALPGDLPFALDMYFSALNVSSDIAASILDEFKQKFSSEPQFWAHLATKSFANAIEHGKTADGVSTKKRKEKTQIIFISTLSASLVQAAEVLQEGIEYFLTNSGADTASGFEQPRPKRRRSEGASSRDNTRLGGSATMSRLEGCLPLLAALEHCLSGAVSSLAVNVFPGTLFDCDGNAEKRGEVLVAIRVAEKAIESVCSVIHQIVGLAGLSSTTMRDSFDCCLVQCRVHLGVILALWAGGRSRISEGQAGSSTAGSTATTPARKGAKHSASQSTPSSKLAAPALPVPPMDLGSAVDWLQSVPVDQLSTTAPVVSSEQNSEGYNFGTAAYLVLSYLWTLKSCMVQAELESGGVDGLTLWRFLADRAGSIDANTARAVELVASPALSGSAQVAQNTDLLILTYRILLNQYRNVDETETETEVTDSDENAASKAITTAERFASIRSSLESVVRSQALPPGLRVAWMCALVKLGYGHFRDALAAVPDFELGGIEEVDRSTALQRTVERGREHLAWVLALLEQYPGLLQMNSVAQLKAGADSVPALAMQSLFGLALQLEEIGESYPSRAPRSSLSAAADAAFRRSLVDQALLRCPGSAVVTRECEAFLRVAGEHKLANHAKWKAKAAAATGITK